MRFWLIKSEPGNWSWDDQVRAKITNWDGVRNYQARNNLKKMKNGDLCFFYHSVLEKKIVGIVRVVKEFYPDPSDKKNKFVMVDVKAHKKVPKPISLEQIKKDKRLVHISLVKQSRLSVMPIDSKSWSIILKMGIK
tara:strand:+ start:212 stop:619 length:408 start_codon:yes stop_codon:yes gene_type:complete